MIEHHRVSRDAALRRQRTDRRLLRSFVIGLTAFLTVVDLFATQAILPSLARAYQVTPAAIGFAVNASTIGMAIAGLAVAFFSQPHRPPARHPGQPGAALDSDARCLRSHPTSPPSRCCASRKGFACRPPSR